MKEAPRINKLQDKTTQYTVYWMHDTSETDIYTQGYVGITKQSLPKRFAKHMYDANVNEPNKKVSIYLRESKNVIMEKIIVSNYEECLKKEEELRPTVNIGQNTYSGGLKGRKATGTPFVGEFSDYHKELQRIGLKKYHEAIRKIVEDTGVSFKEAKKIYSEENYDNITRRTIETRKIAKELGISYSQARKVYCERRDEKFKNGELDF